MALMLMAGSLYIRVNIISYLFNGEEGEESGDGYMCI